MAYILLFILILILFIIVPLGASLFLYNEFFGKRFNTGFEHAFSVDDFEGLIRTRHEFKSNKGQRLVGYYYEREGASQNGILVIAHGFGGGGHVSYMDVINYFAGKGYPCFAYDATGNDESEGSGTMGLPQGVIDLKHAISYVKASDTFPDLPIVLWGHSWGGYSVTSVLNYHPDVRAVITCSGFNRSSDLIEATAKSMLGNIMNVLMPYVRIIEKIKFRDYATLTGLYGFNNANAKIMTVHGENDKVVPIKYGYDLWKSKYESDNRFKFIYRQGLGNDPHSHVYFGKSAIIYFDEYNKKRDDYKSRLGYNINDEKNHEQYKKDMVEYIARRRDHSMWINSLDEELFEAMTMFYNEAIK